MKRDEVLIKMNGNQKRRLARGVENARDVVRLSVDLGRVELLERMMPRDLSEAAEIMKEHGLDLTKVLQDTHAETMLRLGTFLEDFLEIALRTQTLLSGQKENERAFVKNGKLATLYKKIKRAKTVGLLDDVTYKDAELLREIRNEFGHLRGKIHFDSSRIVALATGLSTYEAAETNQAAILAACSKILDKLRESVPRLT